MFLSFLCCNVGPVVLSSYFCQLIGLLGGLVWLILASTYAFKKEGQACGFTDPLQQTISSPLEQSWHDEYQTNWRAIVAIWGIVASSAALGIIIPCIMACCKEEEHVTDDEKLGVACGMAPFTIIAVI